jgi:hypothetical protein
MKAKNIDRAIVIVGSFNPAIFQPMWISQYSLLPDEEMDGFYNEDVTEQSIEGRPGLKIKIGTGQPFQVNNDQALLVFKSFTLQVDHNRLSAVITTEENLAIRFIKKIFKILDQTPISAYGINFKAHLNFVEEYNSIIDKLFEQKNISKNLLGMM